MAKKKKTTKKSTKKTTKKSTSESGFERSNDLAWTDKKVAIFKALKVLGCRNPGTSCSANNVATRAKVTARDVRHYCYHAKAGGLCDLADVEGIRGYGFYLTAKGFKVDPVKAFKAQKSK